MRQTVQLFALGILTTLLLLGCGPISNINIEKSGATVDVRLQENQIERILRRSDVTVSKDDTSILESISSIDFQEGKIHVEGTYIDENGESRPGSFDIEMSATDGMLNVALANVESGNVNLDDIAEANRELAAEFAREAENEEVEFLNVNITDETLIMSVRVNF